MTVNSIILCQQYTIAFFLPVPAVSVYMLFMDYYSVANSSVVLAILVNMY